MTERSIRFSALCPPLELGYGLGNFLARFAFECTTMTLEQDPNSDMYNSVGSGVRRDNKPLFLTARKSDPIFEWYSDLSDKHTLQACHRLASPVTGGSGARRLPSRP